jgi:hypothetical protein
MKYRAPNLAKRFPGAFATALAATLLGIVLAVWLPPWGPYNRSLAVLTATLIGLIWYTFFNYCALHRDERSRLQFLVARAAANRMIEFTVKNPTIERQIEFRWRVVGFRNSQAMRVPVSLGDPNQHAFELVPGEQRGEAIQIAPATGVAGTNFGPSVQLGEPEEAVLQLDIAWRDDLGGTGSIGPEWYAVDILDCRVNRYQDRRRGKEAFGNLGGPDLAPLRVDA